MRYRSLNPLMKASLAKLASLGQRLVALSVGRPAAADTHAPLLDAEELAQLMHRIQAQQATPYFRESQHRHAGDFRSVYLGSGLDFEEARPYQPGDDVRGMDWRTTARTARPHIKIYREEHQPALHVVIDRGPSMRFGTRTRLKVTQAARIAATLGFGAARANTCIGGTLWQPGAMTLPCRNGTAGAMQLAQAAIAPCPPLTDPVAAAMPPLYALLDRLDGQLPRGSKVVLISDFHALSEADMPALLRLASRHQVQAVQVLDVGGASTTVWWSAINSTDTFNQASARMDRGSHKHPMSVYMLYGSAVERKMYQQRQEQSGSQQDLLNVFNKSIGT